MSITTTMFYRLYHTSTVLCNMKKQGMKLCKMINPKSKKQWYQLPVVDMNVMPSVKSLTKTKYEPNKQGIRRIAVLNKLFMKYITDIMSTGTVSMNIIGRGIEISKVKISPDFHTINVYWICKGNEVASDIDSLLNSTAGALRHELSTLRLMGEVPYITFVKDQQETVLIELDKRLTTADYGEDYTPTELGQLLKSDFTMNMKLSPEMQAKIKQLEEELPQIEEPIPEMTHNVYGLDHEQIMNRILASRRKNRDAWSSMDSDSDVISYRTTAVKDVPQINNTSQKKDLAEFLLKRQILQNKIAKQERKTRQIQVHDAQEDTSEDQNETPYEEDEEFYEYDETFYDDRPNFDRVMNIKNKVTK